MDVFEEYARIGKALSNNNRLELISIILQEAKTVEELASETQLSIANTSKHLQVLLKARLVKNHKKKNFIYYEIADATIEKMMTLFFDAAQSHLEEKQLIADCFNKEITASQTLALGELEEKMRKNEIMLIDVRPTSEFSYAHIPGAISIPLDELAASLSQLPLNKTIVAYCRGPYCVMSLEALAILEASGRNAVQLKQGVTDWKLYKKEQDR